MWYVSKYAFGIGEYLTTIISIQLGSEATIFRSAQGIRRWPKNQLLIFVTYAEDLVLSVTMPQQLSKKCGEIEK